MSTWTAPACKAACDAVAALFDAGSAAGYLQFRASTTVIVEFDFNDPAFGAGTSAAPSVATAAGFPKNASAVAAGTMDNYRGYDSNDVQLVSGTVGTSGADFNFDNVVIANGQTVTLSSVTLTQAAS